MTGKRKKIDESDMGALDSFARGITPEKMRPLSPGMRQRWQDAKRRRPRAARHPQYVATMISVDPKLLEQLDRGAKKAGMSRSQFLSQIVRRELKLAG